MADAVYGFWAKYRLQVTGASPFVSGSRLVYTSDYNMASTLSFSTN